jgi:hypothetical protein
MGAYKVMVLLGGFVALEVLRADIASDMAAATHLVEMVVWERLEGELASCADGGLLLEDLLTTRRRHDDAMPGGTREAEKNAVESMKEYLDKRRQEEVEMRWIWCCGDLELRSTFMEKRKVFWIRR